MRLWYINCKDTSEPIPVTALHNSSLRRGLSLVMVMFLLQSLTASALSCTMMAPFDPANSPKASTAGNITSNTASNTRADSQAPSQHPHSSTGTSTGASPGAASAQHPRTATRASPEAAHCKEAQAKALPPEGSLAESAFASAQPRAHSTTVQAARQSIVSRSFNAMAQTLSGEQASSTSCCAEGGYCSALNCLAIAAMPCAPLALVVMTRPEDNIIPSGSAPRFSPALLFKPPISV